MLTVTLDSNIYVSALAFGGVPRSFIRQLVTNPDVRIALSDAILQETLRVLRDKFKWRPEDLQEAKALITESTYRVVPARAVDVVKADASDDRIIECAVASGSDFIVTGDKHLLRLREHDGIRIMRLSDVLRLVEPGRGR